MIQGNLEKILYPMKKSILVALCAVIGGADFFVELEEFGIAKLLFEYAFMENLQHRHDISDAAWALIEPLLPGQKGQWGGIAKNNRLFINAVFWILRTGAPWRDLPEEYGKWGTTYHRFLRWKKKGIWEEILEKLIDDPDYEWLIIDASHCKLHPHAAGAKGGSQGIGRTKGGLIARYIWPWMRMVCQSEYLLQQAPQRIVHRLQP